MRLALKRLRDVIAEKSGLARRSDVSGHVSEILYQNLFLSKNYETTFYPFGGAAGYSFLYLLDRIMEENHVTRAIEFGAGQTTLLLSVHRKKRIFDFYSVEHNKFWANEVMSKTGENVVQCPLKMFSYNKIQTAFYDLSFFDDKGKFDLIVVDGPPSYMYDKYARLGVVEFLEGHLAKDFIIVMDDSNRLGEKTTITEIQKFLRSKRIKFIEHSINSQKCQHIFITEKFKRVKYY